MRRGAQPTEGCVRRWGVAGERCAPAEEAEEVLVRRREVGCVCPGAQQGGFVRRGAQRRDFVRQEGEVEGFVRRGADDVEGIVGLSPDLSSQYL